MRAAKFLPWILSGGLALAAVFLVPLLPDASWRPSASVLALVLGVVAGALPGVRLLAGGGAKRVSKAAIPWAIVAIGFGLDVGPLMDSGSLGSGLLVVVVAMALAFAAALLVGRLFGLGTKASLLLGAGTAVCGNSAIMAVAPTVEPSDEDLGLSLGVINLLGVLMLFALPPAAGAFGVDATQGGILAGLTVHAVPQAIATGEAFGQDAVEWATLYKLLRVAMLVPVVLILGIVLRRQRGGKKGQRPGVPWFVAAFVVAAIVRATGVLDGDLSLAGRTEPLHAWAKEIGRFVLAIALAAIGIGIDVAAIVRVGPKVLVVGTVTVAAMVAGTLPLVLWLL